VHVRFYRLLPFSELWLLSEYKVPNVPFFDVFINEFEVLIAWHANKAVIIQVTRFTAHYRKVCVDRFRMGAVPIEFLTSSWFSPTGCAGK